MEFQKFLKGEVVAEILNVSRSQAFTLMKQGAIPSVRVGHCVRVQESDLKEFIENNTFNNKSSTGSFSSFTK